MSTETSAGALIGSGSPATDDYTDGTEESLVNERVIPLMSDDKIREVMAKIKLRQPPEVAEKDPLWQACMAELQKRKETGTSFTGVQISFTIRCDRPQA